MAALAHDTRSCGRRCGVSSCLPGWLANGPPAALWSLAPVYRAVLLCFPVLGWGTEGCV